MVYTLNVTHRINEPSVDGTKWRVDVDNSILERLDPTKDCEVEVKNARVCYVNNKTIDTRLHTPVQITSNSIAPNYHKNAIGKVDYVLQKPVTLLASHYSDATSYYGPILKRSRKVGGEFWNDSNLNDNLFELESIYAQVLAHSQMTDDAVVAHEFEENIFRVYSHYMDPNNTQGFEADLGTHYQHYYYTAADHLNIYAYNNKLNKYYVEGDLFSQSKWKINYSQNVANASLYPTGLTGSDAFVMNTSEIASSSPSPAFDFHMTPFSITSLPTAVASQTYKTVAVTVSNHAYRYRLETIKQLIRDGVDTHDAWKAETSLYPFTSGMELWLRDSVSANDYVWVGQVSPKNWEAGGPFYGDNWGYGRGAAGGDVTTISKKDYILRPGDLNFEREPLTNETYNLIIDDVTTAGTFDVDGSGIHPFSVKYPALSAYANFAALASDKHQTLYILPGFEYGRMKRKMYKTSKAALEASGNVLKNKIDTVLTALEHPEIKVTRDNRSVIANCDIATPGNASLGHQLHQREPTKFSCAPPRWGTMEFGLRQTFEHEDFWKYNAVGPVEVSFDLCFY
jgi:hypothetical protein